MSNLSEKYRPSSWNEIVGHTDTVSMLKRLESKGLGGHAYWITGRSGTGKTTIARIIAKKLASSLFVSESDVSEVTVDYIRNIKEEMQYYPWEVDNKRGKAWIINEAHGLRQDVIRQLLVLLESLPDNVTVIFTTTNEGQQDMFEGKIDASPLLSRCIKIELDLKGLAEQFAIAVKTIAEAENMDGLPLEHYFKMARKCNNNFRAMLNEIEKGEVRYE